MRDAEIPPATESEAFVPTWAGRRAHGETEKWDALDNIRLVNDSLWLRAYGVVVLIISISFATVFIAAFIVWSWHYMVPQDWTWLQAGQLDKIQSILFSGGMGAVISGIIRTQLAKAKTHH